MSLCEDEGYFHDYGSLVSKGSRGHNKRKPGKTFSDRRLFAKTIHDPENTLSNRAHKRLLADRSDGFCPNVPYSMDKHDRWKTVTPASLLNNHPTSAPELRVIVRKATQIPPHKEHHASAASSLRVLDGDVVTTIFSTKRRITASSKRLNEGRQNGREEIEQARIQFDIIAAPRLRSKSRKFRIGSRTRNGRNCVGPDDYEEIAEYLANSARYSSYYDCADFQPSSSRIPKPTLGDFLHCEQPTTSSKLVEENTSISEIGSSVEIISTKPATLIDISGATHTAHIFEIIYFYLTKLEKFDLREEVTRLLPNYCTMQWFGEDRVSIKTNPSVILFFVIFVEIDTAEGKLRFRINTNTPYPPGFGRKDLIKLLMKARSFSVLLNDLIEFILSTVESKNLSSQPPKDSRCCQRKEDFLPRVNSEMLAFSGTLLLEHQKLAFFESHYSSGDFEIVCKSEIIQFWEARDVCYRCNSPYNTDLFPTVDGSMCRQCVASYVIHQLRLNRFPLQIPLVPGSNNSSIDLLYAVLPAPVISLIIQMSFAYFYTLDYPKAVFLQCPKCSLSLVAPRRNEFIICSCPVCGCYWCSLCNWEPHWPMNCKEFREWSKKWEQQYSFEKFNLDNGERLLCITCDCGQTFYAPENSAHGTICPNRRCELRYDRAEMMRYPWDFYGPFFVMYRKRYHKRGKKEGVPAQAKYVEPKRLIRKEYSKVCAEARKRRFDVEDRKNFEKAVTKMFSCKSSASDAINLRRTALFLVETCTAWLYLHRSEDHQHLKSLVLHLLENYSILQEEISLSESNVTARFDDLKIAITKVLTLFSQSINGSCALGQ
ncbi:hypothetical protein RB195_011550 [Necator americanus]|uniref:IBR domain protein n=1 Tax=Necator americanus TaxID=51031 RepID=A0ABR1D4A4_NECAM